MGLPVTVFRGTDANAPLTRATRPSEWLTIIKACLVDGYDGKPGLGWTLEFGDIASLKMVFKNKTADGGSGGAVQIEAHGGSDGQRQHLRFTAAESITGLDQFVKPCGYRTIATMEATHLVGGWILAGCGRSFFIRPEIGYANWDSTNSATYKYNQGIWVGDIQSFVPNDQHVFTLVSNVGTGSPSSNSTLNDYRSTQFGASNNKLQCQMYATDGTVTSKNYTTDMLLKNPSMSSTYSADPANGYPANMVPVTVSHTDYSNVTLPAIRGIIPGIYQTQLFGYWDATLPITRNLGGIDFDIIYGLYVANFAVQVSGEWYE